MFKSFGSLEKTFSVRKATAIIAVLTLGSRLVGLLRDRLLASHFSAGATLDVYYAAFRIPDFIYNLLILGTLSVAFIPVFSSYLTKDKDRANELAANVFNISIVTMLFFSLLVFVLAAPITHLLLPGFNSSQLLRTVALTRVLLLSPIIFTASGIVSNVLMSSKRFLIVNVAPILYNLGIIAGVIWLYPRFGLPGLGFGVVLGACAHLLVQLPELLRLGFSWKPIFNIFDSGFKKVFKLFVPRLFAFDTSYVSLLIGTIIGSVLSAGSIAVFNFANNLSAVPLGIFALSTASAVFPSLSESYAKRDETGYAKMLGRATVQILFFILPLTILMLIMRAYIVRLVLGAGQFTWQNTIDTFNTLGILSLSLFSQALIPLFARAFYARQNTTIPVIASVLAVVLNATLSYEFSRSMGVAGVAVGFSISSVFNFLLLFILLQFRLLKEHGKPEHVVKLFDRLLFNYSIKILFASCLAGLVTYGARYLIAPVVNTHTAVGILIQAGLAVSLGIIAYIVITWKLGFEESKFLLDGIKKVTFWGSQRTGP